MAAYFYLMASLPMLKADGDLPLSYRQFLDSCKGNVSDAKWKTLENLTLDSDSNTFLKEWSAFYRLYRDELAYQRNQKLGNPATQPFTRDSEAIKTVSAALQDKNPLNAENTLLSFLFQKLDSLVGIHGFDNTALYGYALKLKLLERKTVFRFETGKEELNRTVKGLQEQIETMNNNL